MSKRIVLIGNAASTMVRFRGPLIAELNAQGHEVIAICPPGSLEEEAALAALNLRYVKLESMSRQRLDPRGELEVLRELTNLLTEIKPDIVFSYFLKPAIWGSIAAKRAGVPRSVAMVEGLGYAFSSLPLNLIESLKQAAVRFVILKLLKYAMRDVDHLIVLNQDDASLMLAKAKVAAANLTVIDGIGIDLDHFAPAKTHRQPVRFLLAARLIREKGIDMFIQCAARVKEQFPSAQFRLLGGADSAPGALSEAAITKWVQAGIIEWPGRVSDVRPHLNETSVFVLPTLYREGLPRSTMEAMAMARPVITSDMPGARDSITHQKSGIVFPAGDLDALVAACMHFCEKPDDIAQMGQAAREEAMQRYAIDTQNQRQIDIILGCNGAVD